MNARSTLLGLSMLMLLGVAASVPIGSATAAPAPAKAGPPACVPPPLCSPAAALKRLHFPAGALSYGSPASAFEVQTRGLRWNSADGIASLSFRRPLDYDGGEVSITIFHELLDDSSGDISFVVTPVPLNHGSSFETYGSELTELVVSPESPSTFLQHTALLHSGENGYPWPPGGEWWYFELRRAGSHVGPLRLVAVSIDY